MHRVNSLLRQFLVISLVLLQCIAPLVHAHAGKQVAAIGVHLPGLEIYDFQHSDAVLQSADFGVDSDAIIVGVNTGINQQSVLLSDNSDDEKYLLQAVPKVQRIAFIEHTVNFSPHVIPIVQNLISTSYSPRAPPAQ